MSNDRHALEPIHWVFQSYMRRFPVDKGKNRLIRRFGKRLALDQPIRQTRLTSPPVWMECDLRQFIQRQLYYKGTYEPELLALWMEQSCDASVIFDIGANVGIYSLAAAHVNPTSAVHAFEPTPIIYSKLCTNIKLNGFSQILASELGIADQQSTYFLNKSAGASDDNEGMNFVTHEKFRKNSLQIPVTTVSSYCREHGIDSIDLMKIDIEGSEAAALRGAEELLVKEAIGVLMIEVIQWAAHRSGHSIEDVFAVLWKHGYRIQQFQRGTLSLIQTVEELTGSNIVATPGHHRIGH